MKKEEILNKIEWALQALSEHPKWNFQSEAIWLMNYIKNGILNCKTETILEVTLYDEMATWIAKLIEDFSGNQLGTNKNYTNTAQTLLLILIKLPQPDIQNCCSQIEKFRSQAESELVELKKISNETKNLANLVAGRALNSEFLSIASDEGKIANRYIIGSILMFIVSILSSLVMLWYGYTHPEVFFNSFTAIAYKAAFVGLALTFAFFLARESSFHRKAQHRNRQMAVELAAVEPFLAGMEDCIKHEIKKKLAMKIFGMSNFSGNLDKSNSAAINLVLSKLLEQN